MRMKEVKKYNYLIQNTLIHSLTHSRTHSLTHSLTHSINQSINHPHKPLLPQGKAHVTSHDDEYLFGYDLYRECRKIHGDLEEIEEEEEINFGYLPMYVVDEKKVFVSQANLYAYREHPDNTSEIFDYIAELENQLDNMRDTMLENSPSFVIPDADLEAYNQLKANIKLVNYRKNQTLMYFNAREFAVCVKRGATKFKNDDKDRMERELYNEEYWDNRRQPEKGGRRPAARFFLHPNSPLAESHYLTLNAKQDIVIMAGGKPPPYPTTEIDPNDVVPIPLQKARNLYGGYMIATFVPWSIDSPPMIDACTRWPDGKVLTLDWNGFCDLCDYMYDPDCPFIYRCRLKEIEAMAHLGRDHPEHGLVNKKLITIHRNMAADDLTNIDTMNPFGISEERRQRQHGQGQPFVDEYNDQDHQEARKLVQDLYDANQMGDKDMANALRKDAKRDDYNDHMNDSFDDLYVGVEAQAKHNLEQNLRRTSLRTTYQKPIITNTTKAAMSKIATNLKTNEVQYVGGQSLEDKLAMRLRIAEEKGIYPTHPSQTLLRN